MKILPPVRVNARIGRARSMWDLGLRYGAAYSCTLIAVAAAQLVIRTDVAWGLAFLTLMGLPLSLWLRSTGLRFGGHKVPRPVINSLMMLITCAVTAVVLTTVPGFSLDRLFQLAYATQTIVVLMEVFLVLSVCRCLAIINDKDAVLCTVPSFSVLLLLIVVHKGSEVVVYFLLWATAAALLLALDQRAEARRGIAARVPPVVPNQEIKLSSRSLAGVMAFSLTCAVMLSYGVSNDEEQRNDNWVTRLFTRLSAIGGEVQDMSVNSGPERQIDFNSGPPLPTRTALWRVNAITQDGWPLRPQYWRMFTYAKYDGRSWSQLSGQGATVPLSMLPPNKTGVSRLSRFNRGQDLPGYDVASSLPRAARARFFGQPRIKVLAIVTALVPNTGFVPTLTGVQTLLPKMSKPPAALRARDDAALDIGVLNQNEAANIISEVVVANEYDTLDVVRRNLRPSVSAADKALSNSLGPPLKQPAPSVASVPETAPVEASARPLVELSRSDREMYLSLPPTLPVRVRDWAKDTVAQAESQASDYVRARLLAAAVQKGASYTLRPPLVPENRDATDFFLFGSRRGYCTYFAGALAVTCRAVDIPARVVTGFTNPERTNGFSSEATLREAGSHAWTEIWVPGWGWAMLDATPPASRGHNSPTLFQNWQEFRDNALEAILQNLQKNSVPYALLFALLTLIMVGNWWGERRRAWNFAHALHLQDTEREDFLVRREIHTLYQRAARQLARRYRPAAAWETPQEWLRSAEAALLLCDPEPLRRLVRLYSYAHYNPHPLSQHESEAARQAWQALNWDVRENSTGKEKPSS